MNSKADTHFPSYRILIFFLIFGLAFFLRTWRLPELATFGYDEARDVIAEKAILSGHFTLLGPETKIGNQTIYFGPLHYYLMAPALAVSSDDPLGTYLWTALLTSLAVFLVYVLTDSLLAALFVAVFPLAVIFGRWAWNPNLIPLFATLGLIFFKRRHYFLAGLFAGLMIQLHYSAALMLLLLLPLVYQQNRKKFVPNTLWLSLGAGVGLSPLIFFDLRHQFFLLQTFLHLSGSDFGTRSLQWHYFLWAIPFLAICVAKLPRVLALGILLCSLGGSLYWIAGFQAPLSSTMAFQKVVARLIARDQQKSRLSFNITSLVASDTRGTEYRYFLSLSGLNPLGTDQYSLADHLYVLSFASPKATMANLTFEIRSFGPQTLTQAWRYNGVNIYRFERSRK